MSITARPATVEPSTLPLSSSPDLIVVPASPAEYDQTSQLNADEWKGPLNLAQYFERERFLTERELTENNGLTAWILTSKSIPPNSDGTRPILAACETILKTAYVSRNGSIETIRAHGICSVYTRSEHRGRGYAGRMMQELAKQLETYQQPNGDKGTFSVLFSDIGKQFYARYGWQAFPSTHIDLASISADEYETAKAKLPPVHDITRKDLDQLHTVDYMEETLKVLSAERPNVPYVAILPDLKHFDWHHAREEVSSKLMNLPYPEVKGALHKETGIAMVWTRVFASDPQEWSLNILHIVIPTPLRQSPTEEARDALSALLLRAQREAHAWSMAAGVQVWDPSELVVSAAQNLKVEEEGRVEVIRRDKDHICSLQWTGARAGDDTSKDVVWVAAEKYCWC